MLEGFDMSDFAPSGFIPSEAPGFDGVALGFDGDEYWAAAADSIRPLIAVVIRSFFSIEKPPCQVRDRELNRAAGLLRDQLTDLPGSKRLSPEAVPPELRADVLQESPISEHAAFASL